MPKRQHFHGHAFQDRDGPNIGVLGTIESVDSALNVSLPSIFAGTEIRRDCSFVKADCGVQIDRRGTKAGTPVAAGDELHPATLCTPKTMRTSALTFIDLEPGQPNIIHRRFAARSAKQGECGTTTPLTTGAERGRVERALGTLQDRLAKELRLGADDLHTKSPLPFHSSRPRC